VTKEEMTVEEKPALQIDPLSQSYKATVSVSYEELREACDEYWDKNKEALAKGYKGKKGKGGKLDFKKAKLALEANVGTSKLYRQVFSEKASSAVDALADKEIMLITDSAVFNFEPDAEPTVLIIFHYWPELIRNGDLDFDLTRLVPRDFEQAYVERCNDLSLQNPLHPPLENDSEIRPNHRVLMDVITSCEGEPCEDGTVRGQWNQVKDLAVTELIEGICAHKKGDLFEVSFDSPYDGDSKGKTLDAHVKIHETTEVVYISVDSDELYKIVNCDTREAFKEKFEQEYAAYMDNSEKHQAYNHIMEQVVMSGKIEPPPQQYLNLQVDSAIKRHFEQFKGDKVKALQVVGAKNESELAELFQGNFIQEIVKQMGIKWYAKEYGIDSDAENVASHMLTQITWKDPDPIKAD